MLASHLLSPQERRKASTGPRLGNKGEKFTSGGVSAEQPLSEGHLKYCAPRASLVYWAPLQTMERLTLVHPTGLESTSPAPPLPQGLAKTYLLHKAFPEDPPTPSFKFLFAIWLQKMNNFFPQYLCIVHFCVDIPWQTAKTLQTTWPVFPSLSSFHML